MNWQEKAVQFAQNHNLQYPVSVYALDLVSELGEVAKEILLATDYGQQAPQFTPDFSAELGDLLYSLCLLADAADVDLAQALAATLDKYDRRWQEKGQIGSQDEF